MNDHIVMDYATQPPKFYCLACGITQKAQLPMAITVVVKQADAFARDHRRCRPGQGVGV